MASSSTSSTLTRRGRLVSLVVAWSSLLSSCHCSLIPLAIPQQQGSQDFVNEGVWDMVGADLDPHPDPNDEHYEGMIYVGRLHHETSHRLSLNEVYENGVKYIFGTSFDESHKLRHKEEDLLHLNSHHDIADRHHGTKTREEVLWERRHKNLTDVMPKRYGHVDTDPLDGGVTPTKVVHVEPFFLDAKLVTNRDFGKFVSATYYETEAEKYGWSFVLESFLSTDFQYDEVDPEAEHWVAVPGAYWRRPEGPDSSYKYREDHPVAHVSHRDAAEYCKWVGKRLPGEWEWEAAARAGHYGPNNRTIYSWGSDDTTDWELASKHANLWGPGTFPMDNGAEDGWRGTSPVAIYPPNAFGFYDMTGNVWEWMRGGKHQERIVRGASYVDSLDGESPFQHAATLGARSTIHATTTTGNVGFRCAKAPKKRIEYHYKWHDEETEGRLTVENQFGKRHAHPQRGWEDKFEPDELEEEEHEEARYKRKKVVKKVERLSTEL